MPLPRRALVCAAVLAPSAAAAFRREVLPEPEAGALRAACRAQGLHEQVRAEFRRLGVAEPPSEALARVLAAAGRCPFCGCAVLGAGDHGEGRG